MTTMLSFERQGYAGAVLQHVEDRYPLRGNRVYDVVDKDEGR